MASLSSEMAIEDVMKKATMVVTFKVSGVYLLRVWLARQCLRLAVLFLGCGLVIEDQE